MMEKEAIQKFFEDHPGATYGQFIQVHGRVLSENLFYKNRKRFRKTGEVCRPRSVVPSGPMQQATKRLLDRLVEAGDNGMTAQEVAEFCSIKESTTPAYIRDIREFDYRIDLEGGKYYYKGPGKKSFMVNSQGHRRTIVINKRKKAKLRPLTQCRASTDPNPEQKKDQMAFVVNQAYISKMSKYLSKPIIEDIKKVASKANTYNTLLKALGKVDV